MSMLKELRRNYKRIVAFMLTVAMTFTNIGSNLSVAFAAGETEEALFMLNGNDLQSAIQDAVEGGEVFDFNSLELTAKSTSLKNSYQKLLGTKSGDVYALDVEIDDSYAPDSTSMEAFYNAGTEDVVFLFINESDMVVTFRANVDGYETNRVTINPNAANVEDDADAGYVEDYSNTTMVDDTPETLGATVVPAQSEEGNAVEIETVESVEAEEADVVETEAAAETEESEEVASEAEKETVVETEAEEVVIETEAETEAETESEVEEEIEAEQSEESAVEVEEEAADEVQVGLSMHAVSRVATTVEILDDEVPMAEEAQVEDEDAEEITDEETTAAEIAEGSEVEGVEETTAAEETVVESAEAETAEEETEAVDAEMEAEDETEGIVIETEAAEESSEAADVPADVVVENETPSDAERDEAIADEDGQMLIDDSVEVLGDLDGTSYDTVTLWGAANARAFKVALSDIEANVVVEEGEYLLYITHMLNTDEAQYGKVETFNLSEDDFVDGRYDTAALEYDKDGMQLVEAPVIDLDWFEEESGVLTAYADLSYEVMDGWHVVEKESSASNDGIAFYSVYIGNLDDIDLEEDAESLIVKIQFLNEQGVQIMDPYALEAEKSGESYTVEYELPAKTGYTVTLEDEETRFEIEDGSLTGTFTEAGTVTVNVIYVAGEVSYTVRHWYQNLAGTEYVEDTSKVETSLTGKIDTLTEARDISTPGFTAQDIEQQVITADGAEVNVYYDRNEYTLLYDTTGGSYVPSVTAKYGATVTLAAGDAAPARTGYTFAGWYLDEDLTQVAASTITLDAENVTVYAKWTGTEVSYKVVYMTENADDTNYSYAGTVELKEIAGTKVTAGADTTKPSGFDTTHFTFKSATTETVEADGSTVVVVYYSRNVYRITFSGTSTEDTIKYICGLEEHEHEEPSANFFGSWSGGCYKAICDGGFLHTHRESCFSSELDCGKIEHTHVDACKKVVEGHDDLYIEAKYEAYIGDQWNALVGPGTDYEGSNWKWQGSYYTGFQAKMPGGSKTLTTGNNGDKTRTLYYYVEDPNGSISDPKNTDSGIKFSLYTKVVLKLSSSANPTYNEEFFLIDGYDRYASTITAWKDGTSSSNSGSWDSYGGGSFYYTRSLYELVLHNGSSSTEYSVAYKSDISSYLVEPSNNPLGDGTFDGWYLDPTFQEKYNGDKTMPKGLILYAKWIPVSYEVTFQDASAYGDTVYATQTIERSKTVDAFIPEKAGYIFKGWYTDDACTTSFDYATQITGNITVYAKWAQSTTTTYTVIHQTADGIVIEKDEGHSGKVGATIIAYAITTSGDYAGYVPDKTSESIKLDADPSKNVITFTYSKVELSYTVQYKYNDEVVFAETTVKSEVNTPKIVADVETITEKGYKLADGQVYQIVTLTSGENIVVFNIEPATYTIEYELNGGALADGVTNPDTYVPITLAANPIILNNPTRLGYEFTGWTLVTGTCISEDHNPLQTVISEGSYGNLKFEAGWKSLADELSYDANGGSGTMAPTEGYTFGQVSVKANAFTKYGYHFNGWNTQADGNGTSYDAGDAYTLTVGKDILYAQWEQNYAITVTAKSDSVLYTGKDQSVSGFETLDFGFDGATYTVSGLSASATGKVVGEYASAVTGTPVVTDAAGNDVTYKFDVTTEDGKLTINKRNVTLTSATASKEYDGTPLTDSTVTVTGDGFAENEGAAYTVTGSQTIAGSSVNKFTYEVNDGTDINNYNITKVEGLLTVTDRNAKYEITVEANSYTDKYDGTAKSVSGFKTLAFTVNGQEYTVSGLEAGATGTNAGTYPAAVTGTPVVTDAAGNDVTNQFIVKTVDGALTINKREVTLTSATDSKEYDGRALTKKEVTVSGDDFVKGEGATYDVTGTITLVGTVNNVFAYELNDGTLAENYNITVKYGTLTILSRTALYEITVEANSDTVLYDRTEHVVTGFKTLIFEVEGSTYTVSGLTAEGKGTNAGTYSVAVTGNAVVKDAAGNNVTNQFSVSTQPGTLTINKREVVLTSATDSKPYDGTPLYNNNVEVTGDGFATGEGAGYSVTGTQTLVGSSENYFTYTLNEGTNEDNYTITVHYGQLTVTSREAKYEIEVEANSGEFKYDGTEKNVSGFVTTEFTVNGQTYTVSGLTAEAKATDAGTVAVNVVGTPTVKDANGNDVTSEFGVTTKAGYLIITKRVITLTSATAEKEYNGTPLKDATVTVSGDDFAAGEGAAYDVTGSQTLVGSSNNYFTYTLNENTKAENYEITKVEGTLTVKDRSEKYEITVEANSGEFKYDGTEKNVTGLKETVFTVDGQTYTVEGLTAAAAGTDAGTYKAEVTGTAVVKDAADNDVTAQFIVKRIDGTLEITKRVLTLTSATDEKEYDGTPLTNDTVNVTGDGFAENEGAAYNVTGSQTIVGSSSNEFTYTLNENTKADNYTITKIEGQLTVTNREAKYEINVVANSDSFKYDGTEKSVSGLKATEFTVNGQQYTVEGLEASAAGTDAGTYAANVIGTPVVKDAKGNDVTEQFKVTTTPGTLEITKRDVTLTSGSAERQYNGTPLTNDTITVSGDDFAAGEGATYNVTGSQTLVGSSDNTFTYTLNSNTKAENYNITVVEGQLNVTNRNAKYTITVEANSGNDKYDGTEKSVSGFKTLTFTVEGQTYTVSELTAEAKATDAGEYAVNVVGTPVVTDAAGNDVSAQFAVSTVAGKLTIVKREVTLISASDTQQYNGTPLTNDTITVGGDDFAAGEGATYDVTGSQTLVGSSDNTFSYTLNEGTKADNYVITKEEGTLTVIDRDVKYEVTVTANSKQFMYDGTEKSVSGFETLTFVVEGQTYTVEGLKAEAKGTDADTYIAEVTGTAVVKDAENHDVTAQFLVKTVDGTLVINKRAVTLTSGTDSKQYDGTALINDTVTETGDGFVKGEGAVYDVTGSQTLVGSSANTFTYTLKAGTKAGNYDITKVEGQLTVTDRDTKYQIEVVANGGEYKYDGTEKAVSGFKTLNFIVDGQQYSVSGLTASAAGTDAGTYTVNVEGTAVVKDVLGNDVTAQFAVITVPGTLTIEKRTVVMTSAIDSKQYDGKALTNDTVTVTGDGFADGEGAAYRVTGSQTLVGSSDNTFTYTLNSNTKADNYTIETVEGTLTVINREAKYEVTVKANNATEKYDGTEKSVSGFETLTFTVNGEQYTVEGLTAEAKATDAGTYTAAVEGTAVVKDADGNNVTAQFVVKTEDGQLTIEKRNVTLTSATDSKPYDGTPLINHEVTVSGDGFVEGEGAVYDVTGTRTLVGSNANAFTYELKDGTKADNYVITKVEGTLTITNREAKYEITVVANGGIEKYDGTEKTVTGFETLAFTVNGQQYTVSGLSAEGKGTDAGSYDVKVTGTAVVKDAEGNVVTDQFAVKSVQGTLTIQKRNVTLTSATDSKQYDGTPLRNNEVTVTGDGFVEGEGAVYDVTGSQLLVGTSANSFTYTLKDNTKADNYIIETKEGQLSVTSREAKYEITVVANSGTEKYDGTEKTVTGFETLTFVVEGQTYTVEGLTAEAKAIDAGTYAVSVEGTAVVKDVAGNNVTDQFAVTTQAGSLVIEKRNVTLTSASAEKEYNGTPLTNDKVEVSGDGFVTGEGAAYVVTGSQTLVGSSDNTYTYTLNENTKAENYNITKAEGTLTVNARDEKYVITVVANSGSGKYDGTVKMVSGFETLAFTVDGQNYTVEGLTAENSQTNAGTYTVKVEGTAVVRDSNNNDVTSQFTVNTVDGQLTIEKRNVTLTSATASKPYDGTALTNDTVDVSDEGFVSGEGAAYNVTGSQTLVGTSKNTFGYTLNENTLAANYNITTVEGDLTVTDDGKNPVSKDHAEGPFGLGDTITFTITVENIYAETKTITVTEQEGVTLLAKDGVEIKAGKAIIADVAPGAVVTVEATYVVTEADLLAGEFTNTVTAVFSGEDNSYEAEDIVGTDEFDDLNGHLTVTKVTTSTPKNGSTYALGEKITYKITVKNDGNLTITGIEVEDELTKDSWTIDSLVPGESEEFTAEYVVTEADVLAGSVVNVATAKGTSPDPSTPDVPVDPGEKEEPTDPKNGHLTITKDTTSTPENSIAYVLGETIKYEITATNDGNLTVSDITVTDDLTGDTWNIAALAPGESKAFTAEHVVTEADILAGTVENVATAKGTSPDPDTPDVPVEPGKKVDETEDKNGHLIITKETTSTPKNGTAYALDEIITYKITVTNDGNLTITNITVTDEMTGDEWTVASLAPGETKEFDAKYQVLEKDVLATEVVNVATAKGTSPDPEKPDVPVDPGEKEDPVTTPAPSLFVEKTADKKSGNELGDTITYTIKVVNNGNVTVNDIDVEDEMTGMSEAIASLAPGAERTFTTTYKVAEKDILKGEIVNVVTAKGTDPNKNSVNGSDDETVGTAAKNGHLTITKETTSTPENGESYALGETIEYKITVTNDGNLTITDTTVEDELTGDKWLVSSIEPGESREFTAEYVVTEEDILAGSVVNEATAKGTSPDPEKPDVPVVPGEEEDPTEPTNGHLTIEKVTTSTPANGAAYALGETIEYKITVTNDGNLTITDITVEDELTEDSWKLASLAPGESEEFTAKYVVTEKDILAGTVVNDATAKGTSPDPDKPDVPVDPGKEEDKTEDKNGHLTVTKVTTSTPSNAEKYALGEKITYKITATNDGNLTLTDVAVTDELTGDEWNIDTLAPGESKDFTAEYVVTEKDILAGQVVNEATAKGDSPDPEKPDVPVDPGKEEDKTEDKNGHLTITKVTTSSPSNAEKYALGETITYKITATNDGNLTLTDVVVTDELTNDEWKIDALLPGESKEFTAEYTVVEEDIHRGYVVNEATAKGDSPDPEKPDVPVDPGKEEDKVDDPKEELAVKKEITNEGFIEGTTEFSIGDTIYYKITVTNTGNVTLTDIPVEDVTTGKNIVEIKKDGILGTNLFADYTVDGTTAVIKELKPSEEIEIICTYVVVRDDNGSTILNTAIAGKDDTRTEDDVPAKVEQTYDINIKHEFADVQSDTSVKLPEDYSVQNKLPGYNEKFVAGAVKGYAASPAIFDVTIVDRDITITFVYYKDTIGTDPTNPSKPDQIPDYYQITFTFVSEDTAKGTVTDVTREVHNLYEIQLDENGRVVEVDLSQVKPVSPNAKVTVTPTNKYKFTKWTSDNARVQEAIAMAAEAVGDNFNTTEEIREAAFITDTVFTAHFAKKSSGGGGGGGGSTPGGGSTTTIGGPGVPTANLPEVPVLEVQEEEVPLAALPKTGRTNANALVMLLSSVMLAAFAVTGKKKEEEN